MNKREVNIELTLNKLNVTGNEEIPQGDKNTHFLNLKFDDTLDLSGYQLIVMYGLPYPSKQTLVDTYDNITNTMNILISNNALKINGNVTIEFALKKEEELITVNKKLIVKVISSLNLTSLEVIPSGNLNETIDEKVENIKKLLMESQSKIDEYNNNTVEKIKKFNENVKTKTTEFDNHVSDTTNRAYLELDKKATEYANIAGERANSKVKEQENLSLQAVTNEGVKQTGIVISEGEKQVELVGHKGAGEVEKIRTTGTKVITDEGSKQIQAITSKGEEQTGLVITEGEKQLDLVRNKGTEETGKVTKEGIVQVGAVQNQGAISFDMLLKIQKEIQTLLKNQEMVGNALALNGKAGTEYDKEIRNVAGGEFDSDLLFLNDAGTKTTGKLYYDKNKSGVFKCIQTTTSTVNSTTNFVDVSSLENANKLKILFTKQYYEYSYKKY